MLHIQPKKEIHCDQCTQLNEMAIYTFVSAVFAPAGNANTSSTIYYIHHRKGTIMGRACLEKNTV